MQQREELDWVGHLLRDVVAFLAKNDMMDSAKMLAVAAAHIEHEMKKAKPPVPQPTITPPSKVVRLQSRKRRLV